MLLPDPVDLTQPRHAPGAFEAFGSLDVERDLATQADVVRGPGPEPRATPGTV